MFSSLFHVGSTFSCLPGRWYQAWCNSLFFNSSNWICSSSWHVFQSSWYEFKLVLPICVLLPFSCGVFGLSNWVWLLAHFAFCWYFVIQDCSFPCWGFFAVPWKLSAYSTFPSLLGNSSLWVWKPSCEFSCRFLGLQILHILVCTLNTFQTSPVLTSSNFSFLFISLMSSCSFWDVPVEIENLNCRFTWVALPFNLNKINHKE